MGKQGLMMQQLLNRMEDLHVDRRVQRALSKDENQDWCSLKSRLPEPRLQPSNAPPDNLDTALAALQSPIAGNSVARVELTVAADDLDALECQRLAISALLGRWEARFQAQMLSAQGHSQATVDGIQALERQRLAIAELAARWEARFEAHAGCLDQALGEKSSAEDRGPSQGLGPSIVDASGASQSTASTDRWELDPGSASPAAISSQHVCADLS